MREQDGNIPCSATLHTLLITMPLYMLLGRRSEKSNYHDESQRNWLPREAEEPHLHTIAWTVINGYWD